MIPTLIKLCVAMAAVGIAGIVLHLIRDAIRRANALVREEQARAERARRLSPAAAVVLDRILSDVQRHLAAEGRQADADHLGELRLREAVKRHHPLIQPTPRPVRPEPTDEERWEWNAW